METIAIWQVLTRRVMEPTVLWQVLAVCLAFTIPAAAIAAEIDMKANERTKKLIYRVVKIAVLVFLVVSFGVFTQKKYSVMELFTYQMKKDGFLLKKILIGIVPGT